MEEKLNIYQKLILARKDFLDAGIKKSGVNRHLEFKYFELSDIVPVATNIFAERGLIDITTFTDDEATLTLVNCDNPSEKIVFTSPMKEVPAITSRDGKSVTNPIQTLGSIETYQRRYLLLVALNIVEDDGFDGSVGNDPEKKTPVKKTSVVAPKDTKPATPEERKEITKTLTANSDTKPIDNDVNTFRNLLTKLIDVAPNERQFVADLLAKTDQLKKITSKQIEALTPHIEEKIAKAQQPETEKVDTLAKVEEEIQASTETPDVEVKKPTDADKGVFKELLTKLVTEKPTEKNYVLDILKSTNKLQNVTYEQLTDWTLEIHEKLQGESK